MVACKKNFPQLCEHFVKVRKLFAKVCEGSFVCNAATYFSYKHVHEPFANVRESFTNARK